MRLPKMRWRVLSNLTILIRYRWADAALGEAPRRNRLLYALGPLAPMGGRSAQGSPLGPPAASRALPALFEPAASVQAALLMRHAREAQGKSLADLARALDTSWPAAQRLEQPGSNPTLRQLERAAAALGKRRVVGLG